VFSLVPVLADILPAGVAPATTLSGDPIMNLGTILVIVLLLALIGGLPNWQYSSGWGYYPSGVLGVVLIVVVVMILLGRL